MKLLGREMAIPVAALIVSVCLLGAAEGAAQEVRRCAVSAIQGAPVRASVAGRWSELKVGPLSEGVEAIATGPGARLEIRCDDGLVVTLGAGLEVEPEGLFGASGPTRSVVLRLLRGIVGIDAPNRTWRTFEVRTPLAIASARTTAWLVEYAEPTGAGVFVRSGSVEVTAVRGGAGVRLNGGDGVTILPGAGRASVVRWSEGRIAGAGASLGFGWQ